MTSADFGRAKRRRLQSCDDGVAMVTAILLILVVMGLAVIMTGLVVSQVTPTLINDKSTRTISAAQAGLDAAVSQVRSAIDDSSSAGSQPLGDISKLPCSVTGNVDGSGAPTRFEVHVTYYKVDPTNMSDDWREDAANQIPCSVTSPKGLRAVPGFALLRSSGFDASATVAANRVDRAVEATYKFSLTTINTAGGRIYSHGSGYCLVAEYKAANARIAYRAASSADCSEPNELNRWVWEADYMLHLGSTIGEDLELCISGRPANFADGGNAGQYRSTARLQACATGDQDPLGQRFSWRDGGTWQAQNAANTDYAKATLQTNEVAANALGSQYLQVTSPIRTGGSHWEAFEPEPNVGAGAASYKTQQVVSLLEFGRCLDVFRDRLWMPYAILYPCKQDPASLTRPKVNGVAQHNFRWNHKWVYSEPPEGTTQSTTKIVVKPESENGSFNFYLSWLDKEFCYLAPTGPGYATIEGGQQLPRYNFAGVDMSTFWYPRFVDGYAFNNGSASLPSDFAPNCGSPRANWVRTTASGDKYAWTFRPATDLTKCLTVGPVHHGRQSSSGDTDANPKNIVGGVYVGKSEYGERWSTLVIATCNGQANQQFNADPNDPGSPLRDFIEIKRGE